MMEDEMTLADHAEYWARANSIPVPPRGTDEWQSLYEQWIAFAFADFPDPA